MVGIAVGRSSGCTPCYLPRKNRVGDLTHNQPANVAHFLKMLLFPPLVSSCSKSSQVQEKSTSALFPQTLSRRWPTMKTWTSSLEPVLPVDSIMETRIITRLRQIRSLQGFRG